MVHELCFMCKNVTVQVDGIGLATCDACLRNIGINFDMVPANGDYF